MKRKAIVKEFVTHLTRHRIHTKLDGLTLDQRNNFDCVKYDQESGNMVANVLLADRIRFIDLLPFEGKEVKITIESI